MGPGYTMLGFIVIAFLYVVIGIMAATGTISIFRKIFTPKPEQIFYAMLLVLVVPLRRLWQSNYPGNNVSYSIPTLRFGGDACPDVASPRLNRGRQHRVAISSRWLLKHRHSTR